MDWHQLKWTDRLRLLAGSWFALGLLAVLILGAVLFAMLTWWRPWLEQNWSLTFLAPLPSWYWLLFLLVPLGIVLLYFLKLKRRSLHVPSTFLWRKSIEDLHVNSLFQWLRRNSLLILQLLFLLGLAYALADPTYNSEARGRHMILLIDNSASMTASDESPSRLDAAKAEARKRIEAMDSSDQAMVIAFNNEAEILQSYTNRKEDLLAAIDRIQPTHRPTTLETALALAEGQANPMRSGLDYAIAPPETGDQMPRTLDQPTGVPTVVHIYSDGRFSDLPDFRPGLLQLRLHVIGQTGTNVSIGRVSLARDEERFDRYEVSVTVLNHGAEAIRNRLALRLEVFSSGQRVDLRQRTIDLDPRTVQERPVAEGRIERHETPGTSTPQPLITFSIADPGRGYVRLSLVEAKTGSPWKDDLAVDNVAWFGISPVRRARVLRIGPANDILDAFLDASVARQRAVVTELRPEGFVQDPVYRQAVELELFDLVIFDRCAPPTMSLMPRASTFFIGSVPPLPPFGAQLWQRMKRMHDLYVKEFLHSHPLMRGVETLQGLSIRTARALPKDAIPERASPLMETQDEPVLWSLGRLRYTDLVLTFPLVVEVDGISNVWNTNWPRQPVGTLPLFFDNVISLLGRYREFEESIQPGALKVIDPGVPVTRATVSRVDPPGFEPVSLEQEVGKELVFGATSEVGLYQVRWGDDGRYLFAVNLFDSEESQIEPRQTVEVGGEEITADREPIRQRRELWPWFVFAALVVLLVEWVVYNRRIYV